MDISLAAYVFFSQLGYSTTGFGAMSPLAGVMMSCFRPASAALLLVAVALGRDRLSMSEALLVAGIAFAFVASFLRMGDAHPIMLGLLVVAHPRTSLREHCWVYLVASLFAIVTVLALTYGLGARKLWVTPNGFYVSALGFGHPNQLANILFTTLVAMVFAFEGGWSRVLLIPLSLACAAFSKAVLSSNTATILFVGLCACLLVDRFRPAARVSHDCGRLYALTLVLTLVTLAAFFLVAVPLYDKSGTLLSGIDRILHGRISYANAVYAENGGYTLLGTRVMGALPEVARYEGRKAVLLDNSYTKLALTNGLFTLACLMVLFVRSCVHDGGRQLTFIRWACVMLYIAYSCMEASVLLLTFNVLLVLLAGGLRWCETAEVQSS